MATTISTTKAIYENGVFRPLEQLDLPERGAWRIVILPLEEDMADSDWNADDWYQVSQASLARIWEHPDEDIYTITDGEPL